LASYDQFREDLRGGRYGALEIGGLLLEVDTTDPERVDLRGLAGTIRGRMRPGPQTEPPLVTRSVLADDLRQLGLRAGQVVMLHASARAIGWVVGGPDMILQALLDVLTPEGTLMMYAPWEEWEQALVFGVEGFPEERRRAYLEECPPFSPLRSRANRGYSILTEYLRTWPGACRSDHPTASVVAVGARARWITEGHPLAYGYGAGSPLDRLCQAGGQVLLLGSPLDRITLLHHAEHMARVPHKRVVRNTVPVLREGQRVWITFEEFDTCEGIRDRAPEEYFGTIAHEYLSSGAGCCGEVGAARATLFDAADLVRFAIQWMERVWGE